MAEATNKKKIKKDDMDLEGSLNVLLKEADDEDKAPEIDGDLDDLMKKDGADDKDEGSDDLDKIPDLTGDDEDAPKDDDNDKDADKDAATADKNDFEANADDLTATIQKLAQSGHTVKILITKEGTEPRFTIDDNDDKVYSIKEVNSLLEAEATKGGSESMNNTAIKVLEEKFDKMTNSVNSLVDILVKKESASVADATPVAESKTDNPIEMFSENIKVPKVIKESDTHVVFKKDDYEKFLSEVFEVQFNAQKSDIDKYVYGLDKLAGIDDDEFKFIDESTKAINNMEDSLFNPIKESNKAFACSLGNKKFAAGGSHAIGVITEDILPYLTDINGIKTDYLNELDNHKVLSEAAKSINEAKELQEKYAALLNESGGKTGATAGSKEFNYDKFIEESLNTLNAINKTDMFTSVLEALVESADGDTISKEAVTALLQEAAAHDISAMDSDKGYDTNYPTYEIFSKGVMERMKKINMSSDKSDVSDVRDDDKLVKANEVSKYELPVLAPEKYNASITIKSAIANLVEGLVDDDGNPDLQLCEQAYLYKKVRNPQSIKDFAMPIAIVEGTGDDKKLMAHPKLIENVAHILKNESCMKVYDIATRDDLYALRENLLPYLEKIGMEAPWLSKNTKKKAAAPNTMEAIAEGKDTTNTTASK